MTSITATSISLSWASAGSEVDGYEVDDYEVMWQRDTMGKCADEDEGSISLTGGSSSYIIMSLEEDSSYNITVAASNAAGISTVTVTAMTLEAGEIELWSCILKCILLYLQPHLPLPLLSSYQM